MIAAADTSARAQHVEGAAQALAKQYAPMGWLEAVRWRSHPVEALVLVVRDPAAAGAVGTTFRGIPVVIEGAPLAPAPRTP